MFFRICDEYSKKVTVRDPAFRMFHTRILTGSARWCGFRSRFSGFALDEYLTGQLYHESTPVYPEEPMR